MFRLGRYQGILTWLTYWLAGAAILLSAYQVMTSFARQRAENQALKLREQQTQLHYQGIQQRLREDAALRHEHRHRMAALEALCRQKEYGQLEALLEKWSGLEAGQAPPRFTGNVTVNVIVQDAAARAQRYHSVLDVSCTEDTFTVQTALQLPKEA